MTAAFHRVREQCEQQREELGTLFGTTALLAEHTSELRARCRATRGVAGS